MYRHFTARSPEPRRVDGVEISPDVSRIALVKRREQATHLRLEKLDSGHLGLEARATTDNARLTGRTSWYDVPVVSE